MGDVDDPGRPTPSPEPAESAEQHLVEPGGGRDADPIGVVDQRSPVTVHSVHHRVPATPEIIGDLGHRTAVATDLHRRPPAGPIRDRRRTVSDPVIGLGERHHPTDRVRAPPAHLVPHEPRPSPEARQIRELDLIDVMAMHATAARTHGAFGPDRDCDPQVLRPVANTDRVHVG